MMTTRITSFFMRASIPSSSGTRSVRPLAGRRQRRQEGSDGQEVAGAGVRGRMPELRHGPGLDLADPLAGQVEVLADLLERAGLAPIEAEAQTQDLPLAFVEG